MKAFPITAMKEFSTSDKMLAVGIIGKSPYNTVNKAEPLLPVDNNQQCGIECHWNEQDKVLYLHLSSNFDTYHLINYISKLSVKKSEAKTSGDGVDLAREAGDYLVASGDLTAEVCRSLLLMFHVCHVILLYSPTSVFDLSYVHLFKVIDAARLELQPRIKKLLSSIVGPDWAEQGRPCCPRVLFYFNSCPRQLRGGDVAKIKKLEHSIEDQIYCVLRKSRIVTNICANSLFAIPKNEEFVYINSEEKPSTGDIAGSIRTLVLMCQGQQTLPEWFAQPPSTQTRCSLKQFLKKHLDLAFTTGFDDNVGKYTTNPLFEVPSCSVWRQVASTLTPFFLSPPADEEWVTHLWEAVSVDTRFSQARCAKVLPIAQASYSEGLPPHYATQHHLQKVSVATSVFDTMARGPLCTAMRARLVEACEATFQSRRLCEALSLTGNPCIKPKHSPSDSSDSHHSSGVRYVSACNCGRSKGTREDPYSVRRANATFYSEAGENCQCGGELHSISFPVFQPSTTDFRAALLRGGSIVESNQTPGTPTVVTDTSPDQWSQGEGLSLASEESEKGESEKENGSERGDGTERDEGSDKEDRSDEDATPELIHELITVEVNALSKDKGLVRQPSTTEYLPGMLHTESPPGLLPAFPSWSLVCLGASSLYSHNIGLPEHLHPGFLPHTNFLLPWDCAVRLEQVSAWRSAQAASRGGRAKPPHPHHLTVKIFLGLEYECPRGHRFMMSSPDTVVSGSLLSKECGARLANTDMPLYTHCPCRGSKTMIAQMMRVHIISPKAPVHITLNPKVQPVSGGPIFIPGCSSPVKLSGSAYWVLRLPYIYAAEHGALPRPAVPVAQAARGRMLAAMIGVTD